MVVIVGVPSLLLVRVAQAILKQKAKGKEQKAKMAELIFCLFCCAGFILLCWRDAPASSFLIFAFCLLPFAFIGF